MGCFRAGLCQGKPKLRSIGGEAGAVRMAGQRMGNFGGFFLFLTAFGLGVYILDRAGRGRVGSDFAVGVRWCCMGWAWALGRAGQPVYELDRTQPAREGLAYF
jgi:hypothetical protein